MARRAQGEGNERNGTLPFPPCPVAASLPNGGGARRTTTCLTPAEWAIVHAVRHGMSNARIAMRRGISRDAVKYHVRNAIAKLGLRGRAELQRWRGVPKEQRGIPPTPPTRRSP